MRIVLDALETHILSPQRKQGVCNIVAFAIYIKKYLKAKEELWKLKYFTMQKYNLPKSFKIL